jgi:Kef-type K+ transport system membrane component KefB
MEMHYVFLYLAIILFSARIVGDTFAKFGLPAVLGEILVGVLLGKSALGLIEVNEIIKVLAELGVILLLFQVGLEADIHQLKKVGIKAFIVAFCGCLYTNAPWLFGRLLSLEPSLFNLPFLRGDLDRYKHRDNGRSS